MANRVEIFVAASTKKAEEEINRLGKTLEKNADKMAKAGKKLTVGVTVPLVAAGAAAFKMASDLNEATSQAQQVFGDGADEIIDAAQNMEDSFSETEFLTFASNISDIAQGMGFAASEAQDMSTDVLSLGQDLASFKNLPTEQVINAITSAMTGEREALKSLGIVINEEIVRTKALEMGLADTTGEIDQQAKAAATLQLITERSARAIGDWERTSGDAAGQTKILTSNFKDTAAELGENLIPIGMTLLEVANGLVGVFNDLSPEMQKVVVFGGLAVAALGPLITVGARVVTAFKAIRTAMIATNVTALGLLGTVGLLVGAFLLFGRRSSETADAVNEVEDALLDVESVSARIQSTLDQTTGAFTEQTAAVVANELAAIGMAEAFIAAGLTGEDMLQALIGTWDELEGRVDNPRMSRLVVTLQETGEATGEITPQLRNMVKALAETMGLVPVVDELMGDLGESTEKVQREAKKVETNWRNMIEEMLGPQQVVADANALLQDVADVLADIENMTMDEIQQELLNLSGEFGGIADASAEAQRDITPQLDLIKLGLLIISEQAGFSKLDVADVGTALEAIARDYHARLFIDPVRFPIASIEQEFLDPGAGGVVTHGIPELEQDFILGTQAVAPASVTVPVTVDIDGSTVAQVVAQANLDAGGQFEQ